MGVSAEDKAFIVETSMPDALFFIFTPFFIAVLVGEGMLQIMGTDGEPSGLWTYCSLTEMVLSWMSKSSRLRPSVPLSENR